LFRIGNCSNEKIEPVPVPTSVLVPIPAPVGLVPVPVPVPVSAPTKAPTYAPTKAPTKSPTKAPTKAPLPCVGATTIDPQTQSVNILDSTTNIGTVDTVRSTTSPSCRLYNGFGIWYKIKPFTNNANILASTCYLGTNFDTVITVYKGDNCRPQVCATQNDDDDCQKCSFVGFAVSPNTTYWIFVDGPGTATGNFQLTVK
jgi:hypothetical protein